MSNAKTVWTVPRQPAAVTAFKVTGVAISCGLFAILLARVVVSLAAGTSAWFVLPAFLLGYLLADMLSGTAHWFCDTFFEEDTPVIGQLAHRLCRYERDAEVCFGPSVVSVTLESLAPDFGGQVGRAYLSGPPEVSLIAEPPSLGDHQCSIT